MTYGARLAAKLQAEHAARAVVTTDEDEDRYAVERVLFHVPQPHGHAIAVYADGCVLCGAQHHSKVARAAGPYCADCQQRCDAGCDQAMADEDTRAVSS